MLSTHPKPIIEQVNEILKERICNATYIPGSKLPSESELAAEFGVSRATIRTILTKLSSQGLILRRQGDGTYINERIQDVNTRLGGLWDFSRLIKISGFSPSIQTLSVNLIDVTEEDASALSIDKGEKVVSLKRLFFADNLPVILAHNLIPQCLFPDSLEKIDGNLRIRDILRQYCRQEIAFAITEIRSVTCAPTFNLLEPEKEHILNLRVAFYNKENHPLALGNSYFDDSKLHLRLVQAWN